MKKLVSLLLLLAAALNALAAEKTEWIDIAPNAAIAPDEQALAAYPRTLQRGGKSYDEQALIVLLLGEDFKTEERTEWSHADEYTEAADGRNPWEYRRVTIYDDIEGLSYYDPWVAGERGGEYEAPAMNMTVQESTLLAQALAGEYLDASFLSHPSADRQIRERWSYAGRWMTEKEYAAFVKQKKTHYIVFDEVSAAGLPILDENVMVVVGLNGLSDLRINWHEFTESAEKTTVMPVDEALRMANSTRSAETTLLSAQIVYSNRVTREKGRADEFNLGWLLITSNGNYFVDTVENAHVCDSYEY